MKRVKQVIRIADLFSHPVSFRYNDEPQYESITGGLVSILIIITFCVVFFNTVNRTLNKDEIKFKVSTEESENPTYLKTQLKINFMFAVGLSGINANIGDRYFDIYLQFRHYNSTHRIKSDIPLGPCNSSMWSELGFNSSFESLGLQSWLCPQNLSEIELQGKYTSEDFKFYKLAVKQCDPLLDLSRPCVPDSTIQSFLDAQESFNFNFYFVNTILNPGQEEYVKRYIEDRNYFPFSRTAGVNANLFVSTYTISTDESLYPIEQIRQESGGIVLQTAQMLNYRVRQDEYLKFYLRKSAESIAVEREFATIDDTLSYIGGLFASIMAMMAFMNLYNEFSYELEIAKNVYYYDKNDPLNSEQFHFFTFLGYLIYLGFDKLGIELAWPKLQRFHRFLEEIRKQMDMRLIMKKLLFAERLGLAVLGKAKHKALHMQEPITLTEADIIRKDFRFYKMFRKKYFPNNERLPKARQKRLNDKILETEEALNNQEEKSHHKNIFPTIEMVSENGGNHLNNLAAQAATQDIQAQNSQPRYIFPPHEIRRSEQFDSSNIKMRNYMLKLKEQSDFGDPVARRILSKVDERVKFEYIGDLYQKFYNRNAAFRLENFESSLVDEDEPNVFKSTGRQISNEKAEEPQSAYDANLKRQHQLPVKKKDS